MKSLIGSFLVTILLTTFALTQDTATAYKPKFAGDPARSDAEAAAMGYMRVVVNAQKNYSHKHGGQYATSLNSLVGQGSFTKRMLQPKRGDYTVKFKSTAKEYSLWMTPATVSPTERAFFVDDSGVIRTEEDKQATAESPKAKP
jgi:hypothetical protein